MMRTGLTLFNNLFDKEEEDQESRTAGRNAALIEERNELLAARTYWYRNFTALRYDMVMEALTHEFFLTPIRISQILATRDTQLNELVKGKPEIKYFVNKWPFINWGKSGI